MSAVHPAPRPSLCCPNRRHVPRLWIVGRPRSRPGTGQSGLSAEGAHQGRDDFPPPPHPTSEKLDRGVHGSSSEPPLRPVVRPRQGSAPGPVFGGEAGCRACGPEGQSPLWGRGWRWGPGIQVSALSRAGARPCSWSPSSCGHQPRPLSPPGLPTPRDHHAKRPLRSHRGGGRGRWGVRPAAALRLHRGPSHSPGLRQPL